MGDFLSQNTKKQNLSQKIPITFQSVNLRTLKQFEWQLTTLCQGILWVHAKDQPHAWTWLGLSVCDEISNLGQKQAWGKVTCFIVKSCCLKETFSNARQSEKFKPKKEHNLKNKKSCCEKHYEKIRCFATRLTIGFCNYCNHLAIKPLQILWNKNITMLQLHRQWCIDMVFIHHQGWNH